MQLMLSIIFAIRGLQSVNCGVIGQPYHISTRVGTLNNFDKMSTIEPTNIFSKRGINNKELEYYVPLSKSSGKLAFLDISGPDSLSSDHKNATYRHDELTHTDWKRVILVILAVFSGPVLFGVCPVICIFCCSQALRLFESAIGMQHRRRKLFIQAWILLIISFFFSIPSLVAYAPFYGIALLASVCFKFDLNEALVEKLRDLVGKDKDGIIDTIREAAKPVPIWPESKAYVTRTEVDNYIPGDPKLAKKYRFLRPKRSCNKKVKFGKIKQDSKISKSLFACPICLEDFKDNETLLLLPCIHYFHYRCLCKLRNDTEIHFHSSIRTPDTSIRCPICKLSLFKLYALYQEGLLDPEKIEFTNRD